VTPLPIKRINPAGNAAPGGHYSHCTVAAGLVFVSGQLPITPAGERLVHASFAQQARQTLANVGAVLDAAGSSIDKLIQVRVYVDDLGHWPEFDALYAEWAGATRPSRAVVPAGALHHGFKIEIEAVALAPEA
jgi:2-iminobutanoate/2-iminopropanoate deaminase